MIDDQYKFFRSLIQVHPDISAKDAAAHFKSIKNKTATRYCFTHARWDAMNASNEVVLSHYGQLARNKAQIVYYAVMLNRNVSDEKLRNTIPKYLGKMNPFQLFFWRRRALQQLEVMTVFERRTVLLEAEEFLRAFYIKSSDSAGFFREGELEI